MAAWTITGWTYESDLHCSDCALDRFGERLRDDENPPEDTDGNPVRPLFATDTAADDRCGDCGADLDG